MAQLAVSELTAAGTALIRAGRWDAARQLLQAGKRDDPNEKLQLVLAEAEAAWTRTLRKAPTATAPRSPADFLKETVG
jgi:hypothetical protein